MRYYQIDFTATTGGTVQILADSKEDAWAQLDKVDYISNQVEDQVPDAGNMRCTFSKSSIRLDPNQEPCCPMVPDNRQRCDHEWYFPVGMKDVVSCRKCVAMRDLR